ncbi:MAG TPA: hypothetical protein PLB25_20005 [Rhodoferax sp.]|nr:hypothetical protein [Rhodoferax sp.]
MPGISIFPDWGLGISLVMTVTTLATAQWSVSVLRQRRWHGLALAAFWIWLSVHGIHWAHWSIVRPQIMIREGQWLAPPCLYALCGVIWYRLVPMLADLHGRWQKLP